MNDRNLLEIVEEALQDNASSVLADAEHLEERRTRLESQVAPITGAGAAGSRVSASAHSNRANFIATPFPLPPGGGSGLSPRRTSEIRFSPTSSTPGGVPLPPTSPDGAFGLSSSSPAGGVFLQQTTPGGAFAQPSVGSAYSLQPPPPVGAPAAPLTNRTRAAAPKGSKRTPQSPVRNSRASKRSSVSSAASMASKSPVDSRSKQPQPRKTNTSLKSGASDNSFDMSPVGHLDRNLLPKFDVGDEDPQLKLYPLGSGNVVDLDQSGWHVDLRNVLKNWLAHYQSKIPGHFEVWFWRGMGAGNACFACKVILKSTSSWTSPDENHACMLCLEKRRPCIRAMNVEDAAGNVTGRSLHVLPARGENPFGCYVAS